MTVKSLTRSSLVNNRWYENMLVGNAAYSPPAYELLETIIVPPSTSASITFSNLANYSDYKHLQVRWVAKSVRGGQNSDDFLWQANGDTTQANYRAHVIWGNGSTVQTGDAGAAGIYFGYISGSMPAGNYSVQFQAGITDILEPFNTTKSTTVITTRGSHATWFDGAGDSGISSGVYLPTNSLTSFTMKPRLAGMAGGSRFSLYGIRG
jgi:hypothetical protein